MLRTRVIPCLLLRNESLVKTVQFGKYAYIGDPCNTVRIFNELEVDELMFLDITATTDKRAPNLKLLSDIANECFMPLSYGGGVNSFAIAQKIYEIGFEKIVINTHAITNPALISEITNVYGNQAVVVSIDVKRNIFGKYTVRSKSGHINTGMDPVEWAMKSEKLGAGEILLTSIDHEGTWDGYDYDLIKKVAGSVSIPVIANGGAGCVEHLGDAIKRGGAAAVAVGSMVTFQKKGMGVLVNFPCEKELSRVL
jgi:cyclase